MSDLARWAAPHIQQQFLVGSLMSGGEVIRFSKASPDGSVTFVAASDRDEVLAAAAKQIGVSTRLIALTSGVRHEGARAVIADVYERETGETACLVQRWRLTLSLHGKLVGSPVEIGPAKPLPRSARRLP